jgi:hypothetical protein
VLIRISPLYPTLEEEVLQGVLVLLVLQQVHLAVAAS